MNEKSLHRKSIRTAIVLLPALFLFCASLTCAETSAQQGNGLVATQLTLGGCPEFLKRNSITEIKDCKVSEAGSFGAIDGQEYQYILYCIIPSYSSEVATCGDESFSARYHRNRGLSILMQNVSSKQTKIFMERAIADIGIYIYEMPEIVNTSFGKVMHIPIKVDGTGNGNESEYYLWSDKLKKWSLLDSTSWMQDLYRQVPKGFSINKGVWPDLTTMTAKAWLYQKGDANCCPSGGTASIELTLKNNRFFIKSIQYRQNEDE